MTNLRVYLAGPTVFLPEPMLEATALKRLCTAHGLTGTFPLDVALALDGLSPADQALAIKNENCRLIRECSAVVADMTPFRGPGMDQGTAYEIGFAEALGKPVFGYTRDFRAYHERVQEALPTTVKGDKILRDTQGMAIEDFGLTENLMLSAGIHVFPEPESAIMAAARRLLK